MKTNILKNRMTACVLAVFCTLLWGTAFPFIKLGYAALSIGSSDTGAKLLFAGLRFSLAGAMVLCFLWVSRRRLMMINKKDIPSAALLGGVQTFAQYLFTYIGIGYTTGVNTSIITACAAFLTVSATPLFFRGERLTALKLAGCALGFCGVLAMNRGGGISADTLLGDGLIFMSTVCAACGNILSKKLAKARDPVALTAWQLLFGGALLTVAGLIFGGRLDLFNGHGLPILLWLAFVSAAAFTVWTALLKHHPADRISVFNLLVPVFGTVLSGLLLGENAFRPEVGLSLLLIAAGIVLVNLSRGEKT